MANTPTNRPPTRKVSNTGGQPTGSRRNTNMNVAPRRDPFPYVMSGVIGALVVGLALVLFLLLSRNNTGPTPVSNDPNAQANPSVSSPVAQANTTPEATVEDAPRMPITDFIKLYSDPAKRPLIIDVRGKAQYDQGHIKGAISLPHADLAARLSEVPKDRLVVAYCQ